MDYWSLVGMIQNPSYETIHFFSLRLKPYSLHMKSCSKWMGKHGWIFRVWQPYIAATGHKWYQVIVTVTPRKIGFFSKSLMTEKPMEEPSKHQPPSLWSSSLNSDLKVAASSRSVASRYAWSANEIWSVLSRKWCLFGSSYAGLLEGTHICVIHTSIYLTYDGWICQ